jgi:hypothetical protein
MQRLCPSAGPEVLEETCSVALELHQLQQHHCSCMCGIGTLHALHSLGWKCGGHYATLLLHHWQRSDVHAAVTGWAMTTVQHSRLDLAVCSDVQTDTVPFKSCDTAGSCAACTVCAQRTSATSG